MESQMYGTPVLGANIGGIPELIQVGKTGELFESGNGKDLKEKIEKLWGDKKLCEQYSKNCKDISFDAYNWKYSSWKKILWYSGKVAFIFSISIEMLQLFLRLGTFQLSDLFYNTVGGMIGGLMYYGIAKAKKHL